jgi:hypothetical protein
MESAQEFVERYLAEQAVAEQAGHRWSEAMYERFYSAEYQTYFVDAHVRRQKNLETFSRAEISDGKVIVITTRLRFRREHRRRYLLRSVNSQWEIYGAEDECFACRGTGRKDEKACTFCEGVGWKDYLRDANKESA